MIGSGTTDQLSVQIGRYLKSEIDWLFEKGPLNNELLQVFVSCFSEAKDQLSQWRGYSHETSGVSIGFDLREIRSTLKRDLAVFAPCIYEDDDKRKVLRKIIQHLFRQTARLIHLAFSAPKVAGRSAKYYSESDFSDWFKNDPNLAKLLGQIENNRKSASYNLLHVAALMKHASFREEREWRLVLPLLKKFNDHALSVSFGSNNQSLVPRLSQDLEFNLTPIQEVIAGPGSHPFAVEAIKQYMGLLSFHPEISKSITPYRSTS